MWPLQVDVNSLKSFCRGKVVDKVCNFMGILLDQHKTNFPFGLFLIMQKSISGGSNKQSVYAPPPPLMEKNKEPTCRRITDKILRVASCISLSRAIAKESTYKDIQIMKRGKLKLQNLVPQ
jgi:hypothetical protein